MSLDDLDLEETPLWAQPRRRWQKSQAAKWLNNKRFLVALGVAVAMLLVWSLRSILFHTSTKPHKTLGKAPVAGSVKLSAEFFPEHHSERVKIRYGSYSVPPMDQDNGMATFRGFVSPPCTDCLITFMQAGLEYPDGSIANVDTGMWLHHAVFIDLKATNQVCGGNGSPFFASGNERTAVDLSLGGTVKSGYYFQPGTSLVMSAELMNMKMEARDVVITVTVEYIPNSVPAGFSKASAVWIDVGGCQTSEMPAEPDAVFEYSSHRWNSTIEGRLIFIGAHLHDGGTHVAVWRNGKEICDSIAQYGRSPGYVSEPGEHHDNHGPDGSQGETLHISRQSVCHSDTRLAIGDTMSITAYYNTSMWTPMVNMDGSLEEVMGISIAYVAEDLM